MDNSLPGSQDPGHVRALTPPTGQSLCPHSTTALVLALLLTLCLAACALVSAFLTVPWLLNRGMTLAAAVIVAFVLDFLAPALALILVACLIRRATKPCRLRLHCEHGLCLCLSGRERYFIARHMPQAAQDIEEIASIANTSDSSQSPPSPQSRTTAKAALVSEPLPIATMVQESPTPSVIDDPGFGVDEYLFSLVSNIQNWLNPIPEAREEVTDE